MLLRLGCSLNRSSRKIQLGLLLHTNASNSEGSSKGEKHNISEAIILSSQKNMKLSVDVQTESCIFPCSSSVSYESFGTKAVLWEIPVTNVISKLFNSFSSSKVNLKRKK